MIKDPAKELVPFISTLEGMLIRKGIHFEDVSYSFDGAFHFLNEFWKLCNKLSHDYKKNEISTTTWSIGNALLIDNNYRKMLTYNIDAFLSFTRKTQDRLMELTRKLFPNKAIPRSMNSFVEKINDYNIPNEIKEILAQYWRESGSYIKSYRDSSEHYLVLSTDARVFKNGADSVYIYLLLPTNPKNKSAKEVDFEGTPVHALNFVLSHFGYLVRFMQHVCPFLIKQSLEIEWITETELEEEVRNYSKHQVNFVIKGYEIPFNGEVKFPGCEVPDENSYEAILKSWYPDGKCGLGRIEIEFKSPEHL